MSVDLNLQSWTFTQMRRYSRICALRHLTLEHSKPNKKIIYSMVHYFFIVHQCTYLANNVVYDFSVPYLNKFIS